MAIDDKSECLLQGVHPDLCSVVRRAREIAEFRVTEGLRNLARQKQLKAQGKSRTLNSRHLTGHAVDLVDLKGTYSEPEMRQIADAMKQAATELGVAITWGGDWSAFCDTPHFELEWHAYPASSLKSKIKTSIGGIAAGGGVVAVPAVPSGVTDAVAKVEEYAAISSRMGALAKGVMTFQPAGLLAVLGVLMVVGFAFWPKGESHAGGSD